MIRGDPLRWRRCSAPIEGYLKGESNEYKEKEFRQTF